MKIVKVICVIVGILFSFLPYAREQKNAREQQPARILKISERDQDGNEPTINSKIADINSTLEIGVDVMELKNQLKERGWGKFPNELYDNISKIKAALEKRNESLDDVVEALELFKQGYFKDYVKKLREAAKGPAKLLQIDQIKKEFRRIRAKYKSLPKEEQPSNSFYYVFEAAEEVLAEFEKELDEKVKESGIYIQMGAWLITKGEERPIHLPGFDNLPEIDPYVVPRWQFSPTQEQRQEYEKLSEFAKKNKQKGVNVIKGAVKQLFEPLVNRLESKLNQSIQSLIEPFEENIASLKGSSGNTLNCLKELRDKTTAYIEFIARIVDRYKNIESTFEGDLTRLIVDAEKDINDIINKTDSLKTTYVTQIACIKKELAGVPAEVKQLVEKLENTSKEMGKENKKLADLVTEMAKDEFKKIMNELMDSREFDAAALEFSESVFKLDITNIPNEAELPLKNTGPRKKGDVFFVKLVAGTAEPGQKEMMDSREVLLFEVLPHIRTVAGLIFARSTESGDGPFEMAPSYNILFKGFWDKKKRRKSVVYNRIWDWSFGLNLSSLDFNGDKTQELGIGLVISGIKDWLQIGFGYNVMANEPYYFFGLRIPIIPVLNLSGGK